MQHDTKFETAFVATLSMSWLKVNLVIKRQS